MIKFLSSLILAALACCSWSAVKLAEPNIAQPGYVSGEVVVRLRPSRPNAGVSAMVLQSPTSITSALAKNPCLQTAKIFKYISKHSSYVVKLPKGVGVYEAMQILGKDPTVAWVEPVYEVRPLSLADPNDYYWNKTYYDDFIGFSEINWPYMWNMPRIQALEGWNIWPGQYFTASSKPRNAIKVGVIDTGIDPDHPDFINAGGVSSDSADGGQIDWSLACKFITDTNNPEAPSFVEGIQAATDSYGHGTHVAGIAAASANNGIGVMGVGFNAQVVPVRIFTTDTAGRLIGRDDDLAAAITYCADQNLPIINLSVGTTSYSYLITEAVNYAFYKGSLIIAAGNEAGENPSTLGKIYPAANSKVLGVSPTGMDDDFASGYAGTGDYIGISAPSGTEKTYMIDFGEENFIELPWYTPIWSTVPTYDAGMPNAYGGPINGIYAHELGTSMATPHVSGLAALYADMKGYNVNTPGGNLAIWRAIQRGADNPYGGPDVGYDEAYGFGRINVYKTLMDMNTRAASTGSASGQVFNNSYPTSGVPIKITKVGASTSYQTTTQEYGFWRIPNIPTGTYSVKNIASAAMTKEIKFVDIVSGCDTPGLDLYLGPVDYQLDDTPPEVPVVKQDSAVGGSLHASWWSRDLQSGIYKYEISIGTTPGGTDILGWTDQGWRMQNTFDVSAAGGNPCYVNVRATNGAGLVSGLGAVQSYSLSSTLTLGDYSGELEGVPVSIDLLDSNRAFIKNIGTTLDSTGKFTVTGIEPGTYYLGIKPSHWLRRVTGPVSVVDSDVVLTVR